MAGTWQWQEIRRDLKHGQYFVRMKFVRDNSGEISSHIFSFDSEDQITTEGPVRFQKKADRLELKWSALNRLDFGENSKEILIEIIKAIRNSPTVTFEQAKTWYDNNFPDAVWKSEKFIDMARKWLQHQLGYVPTWDQFKTYVINNVFQEVDE